MTAPGLPPLYGTVELQLNPPSGAGALPPRGFAGAIDALLHASWQSLHKAVNS